MDDDQIIEMRTKLQSILSNLMSQPESTYDYEVLQPEIAADPTK